MTHPPPRSRAVSRPVRLTLAACLPVAVVMVVLFAREPSYRASGVVTLSPGAQPGESTLPLGQRASVVRAEQAVAEGPELRTLLDPVLDFSYDYSVEADDAAATLRFTATASSAQEAMAAAATASGGFVSQRPSLPGAESAPGATVSEAASLPTEPTSPPFFLLAVGGIVAGAALAGALAVASTVRRRRTPGTSGGTDQTEREGPGPGPAARAPVSPRRVGLGLVVIVGATVLLAASLAGAHELWEVRTTTDHQVEAMIECIPGWLDEIPDGASIYPQPDPPEVRDQFWLVRLTELAFPRLRVATAPEDADFQVKIVLVGEGGREPCAGYAAIVTPA